MKRLFYQCTLLILVAWVCRATSSAQTTNRTDLIAMLRREWNMLDAGSASVGREFRITRGTYLASTPSKADPVLPESHNAPSLSPYLTVKLLGGSWLVSNLVDEPFQRNPEDTLNDTVPRVKSGIPAQFIAFAGRSVAAKIRKTRVWQILSLTESTHLSDELVNAKRAAFYVELHRRLWGVDAIDIISNFSEVRILDVADSPTLKMVSCEKPKSIEYPFYSLKDRLTITLDTVNHWRIVESSQVTYETPPNAEPYFMELKTKIEYLDGGHVQEYLHAAGNPRGQLTDVQTIGDDVSQGDFELEKYGFTPVKPVGWWQRPTSIFLMLGIVLIVFGLVWKLKADSMAKRQR